MSSLRSIITHSDAKKQTFSIQLKEIPYPFVWMKNHIIFHVLRSKLGICDENVDWMCSAYQWYFERKGSYVDVLVSSKNTLGDIICTVYNERFIPVCSLVHTGHNAHGILKYVKARQGFARQGSLDSSVRVAAWPNLTFPGQLLIKIRILTLIEDFFLVSEV